MMIPYESQIQLAKEGYAILKQYAIVYLATEERTGKSLAAVLITEMCQNIEKVLIVTKNKALPDWLKLQREYSCVRELHICTYTTFNPDNIDPDIVILDEAHNYISAYPKPGKAWHKVKKVCKNKPIIYLSATPHAQGYQQLYHQFALSTWSPWIRYENFYSWFNTYGIPTTQWLYQKEVPVYNNTHVELCKGTTDHLFITKTRKELGFTYEPKDKIHYVQLSKQTRELYNTIVKDKVVTLNDVTILCDSVSKERAMLHMLEGGVSKYTTKRLSKRTGNPVDEDNFLVLENQEKIDYIKAHWGDKADTVIFYNYIAEKIKLEQHFKNAIILQATAFAEGVELSMYEHLIVYSQDYSTARHTQRRARQASRQRTSEIIVHFLLVEDAISEQVYNIVSINKENFVDSRYEEKYI